MHITKVSLHPEKYPTRKHYPFNLDVFQQTKRIEIQSPVTIFVGENGTGKSTLLEAIARKSGIHIWENTSTLRFNHNPYESALYRCISVNWRNGFVPGSFFSGEIFRDFSKYLDEWAVNDPGMLQYFGGESLMTKSHGQSLMAYFRNRYSIKGLYLLDEPETALSPKSQIELVKTLYRLGKNGQSQFIIATHSPILMACPTAVLFNFENGPVHRIRYTDTSHYRIYKNFMRSDHRVNLWDESS